MAAQTPRKRKQSWSNADSRCSSFVSPVKRFLLDCTVVLTPLRSRNPNSGGAATNRSPTSRAASIGGDKENMAASPQRSSVARKLVVSPPVAERGDAYVFSPVKSPDSSPRSAVPAASFYKKRSDYMTPLDRKGRGVWDMSPPAARSGGKEPLKVTRTRKPPSAKKRKATVKMAPPRKDPKNKSPPTPKNRSRTPQEAERGETSPKVPEVAQKTAILGLKVKPRPRLMVGAAFFATSKKPHSAPRRPPAYSKVPAPTRPSSRPAKESAAPTAKSEGGKGAAVDSQKGGGVSSVGGNGESEGSATERSPGETRQEHRVADASQILFDTDDSIVKPSEKKDSSVYPIFSTPAVAKKRPLDFRGDLASPVCSSTPAASKVPKLSKKKDGRKVADDQLIIDAGQKHFGPVSCGSCGMIFSASSAEDEAQHAQYHQRLLERIRYVGWKKERIVAKSWGGKILMICPEDPKYALRKAEEVRELVDAELGFQQTSLNSPARTRTYLYVTSEKTIAGCLIAEPIKQAFRVLAEPSSPEDKSLERHRAWRCSSDPEPAICGISRIWVFAPMRRRSIASRLVDAVRSSFIYGSHLSTNEIAFSDPTPDGKLFASTYCSVPDFLVYNFLS